MAAAAAATKIDTLGITVSICCLSLSSPLSDVHCNLAWHFVACVALGRPTASPRLHLIPPLPRLQITFLGRFLIFHNIQFFGSSFIADSLINIDSAIDNSTDNFVERKKEALFLFLYPLLIAQIGIIYPFLYSSILIVVNI